MRSGRSPTGAVWKQQLRGDLVAGEKQHVLSVLTGLKHFYERVQHPQPVQAAMYGQFHYFALRFFIHTHGWERLLSMDGVASN
eukprot:5389166-Pyramimonas_sp.AAC.1